MFLYLYGEQSWGNFMINNLESQQAYIDSVMKRLPDVKKGAVHTMQKGDNLWNLAKKALGGKNLSNQQVSDYMLLIAKLNNLDTVEKMNGLKISDKIYMPESASIQSSKASITQNSNEVRLPAAPPMKEYTSAEQSILALKEIITNDKTVFVEQAYPRMINLFHVYNDYKNPETGYHSRKHPLLSFKRDKENKIVELSFEDKFEEKDSYKYDYDMDAKGNIIIDKYVRQIKVGKLDKKEVAEIMALLNEKSVNAKLSY